APAPADNLRHRCCSPPPPLSLPTRRSSDLAVLVAPRRIGDQEGIEEGRGEHGGAEHRDQQAPVLGRGELHAHVLGVGGVRLLARSEEPTSELQSRFEPVCRPPPEKKKTLTR